MTAGASIFSDANLADFRAMLGEHMPYTARIQSAVTTAGPRPVTTYVDRLTGVPCRVSGLKATELERLMADAVGTPIFVAVFFPAGTVVRGTDRVSIVGESETDDGAIAWVRTYNVVAIDTPRVATNVQQRIVAQEMVP